MCFDRKPPVVGLGIAVKGTLDGHCKPSPNLCEALRLGRQVCRHYVFSPFPQRAYLHGFACSPTCECFRCCRQDSGSYVFVSADQPGNFRYMDYG